jgi:tetratricopeptide (TPR) repeat protein
VSEDSSEPHDAPQGAGPAAAVLAAASRAKADEYLDTQIHLARAQAEREAREENLRGWSQFVRHTSDVLKLAFEAIVALIVLGVAIALGAAVHSAVNDRGAVIEAFSVPPDLETHGLTGQVVAGKVLDRLSDLQAQTNSNRAGSSYVNNWGNDIKVQIPETGVSIGQLYLYLCQWLGHETHIGGEIYRDDQGLAITARVGAQSLTLRGTDGKLDDLIRRAAEAVYRATQPYRYAVYLDNHGRSAEAGAIYRQLIAAGSREDRAWAHIGLAAQASGRGDFSGAAAMLKRAVAIEPGLLLPYANLANNEGQLQHDELQLFYLRKAVALEARGPDRSMSAADFAQRRLQDPGAVAQALGDMQTAMSLARRALQDADAVYAENLRLNIVVLCAALHDRACAAEAIAEMPPAPSPLATLGRTAQFQQVDFNFEDWKAVIAKGTAIMAALETLGPLGRLFEDRAEKPTLAFAHANLGDFRTAHALIDGTPLDCVLCLRLRGTIASLEHKWPEAETWFRRAVAAAPSLPAPYADYGAMLLAKGDIDRAIAQFGAALERGPRDHDVLELWGEALIRKNRSDLALGKFRAALALAPNWPRLHLKYAQALLYTGRRDAAKAEFARAAALGLTPAERKQLPR